VERSIGASPDTPYPIGGITEAFTSALVLRCMEEGELSLDEPLTKWTSLGGTGGTVRQILSHTSGGGFRFDPSRFAALTPVVDGCTGMPFRQALAERILDPQGMQRSVPGQDLERPEIAVGEMFAGSALSRYADVTRDLALPYRVDGRSNASVMRTSSSSIDASTGLISTVRDLARFDVALTDRILLRSGSLDLAFSRATGSAPFGLGWFVQDYKGNKLVWQFGETRDAYSSLIVKVPDRGLTLILLANSDGLTASFPMSSGDVTASLFARVFLSIYL
jgi:CubicO group peptidase (beta-lactamase class C family)